MINDVEHTTVTKLFTSIFSVSATCTSLRASRSYLIGKRQTGHSICCSAQKKKKSQKKKKKKVLCFKAVIIIFLIFL